MTQPIQPLPPNVTPGSGTTPAATTTTLGLIQLGGDLGGTAAAPTVPGLAARAVALTPTAVQTAAMTAAAGQLVQANATTAALTVTLPAATAGLRVGVAKVSADTSVNTVTVAAAGTDTISGTTVLRLPGEVRTFTAVAGQWVMDGGATTLASTDGRYGKAINLETYPGVDPTGGAECGTAIQAAFDAAHAQGVPIIGNGYFKHANQLTIVDNCDLSRCVFSYTGTAVGPALSVGTTVSALNRKTFHLPYITAAAKTAVGWAQVAGVTGVQLTNLQTCDISVAAVSKFETGVLVFGQGYGCVYNTIRLGDISDNKRNVVFDNGPSGYTNQNTFIGGRLAHSGSDGTPAVGSRHVYMSNANSPTVPDNNTFVGTSLESPGAVEYIIETFGNYNAWINCRWENTGAAGTKKVWFRTGAKNNVLLGGYEAQLLNRVDDGSTYGNRIVTGGQGPFVNPSAYRDPAALLGAGATMYDTTLAKPIWSDGTNWRDATGAVV